MTVAHLLANCGEHLPAGFVLTLAACFKHVLLAQCTEQVIAHPIFNIQLPSAATSTNGLHAAG